MATLAQFSRNIRRRGSQVENSASRIVKAVAVRSLKSLVRNTPADKGVARSNWRVGIGAPTRAVIGAYAPGKNLGIGENANASAAINAGRARINSLRSSTRGLETSIYISNAAPYIEKLNNGSSTQVGKYFIQRALLEAQTELSGFRVFER
jgi:hypothetical protein